MILTWRWRKWFRLPHVRTAVIIATIITVIIISITAITKVVTCIFATAPFVVPRFFLLVLGVARAAALRLFCETTLGKVFLCADRESEFLFAIHANENLVPEFLKLIHV